MCSKEDCNKPVKAKGFCTNHYGAATLETRKKKGYVPVDVRRSSMNWNSDDYEQYWQFVKKELKIV